jgi:hypothetical protein
MGWQSGKTYVIGEKLTVDTEVWQCRTAGVQLNDFESNAARWVPVTSRDSAALQNDSTGVYETVSVDVRYISPEQQGGIYGTIYRQYFGVKTNAQTITANGIDIIVDYSVYDATANTATRGNYDDGTDRITLTNGSDVITFTIAGLVCTSGWADYNIVV